MKERKRYVLLPNITVLTAVPCALPYKVTQSSIYHVVPFVLTQLPHCFDQFGGIVSVSPWFSSKDCSDFENSD